MHWEWSSPPGLFGPHIVFHTKILSMLPCPPPPPHFCKSKVVGLHVVPVEIWHCISCTLLFARELLVPLDSQALWYTLVSRPMIFYLSIFCPDSSEQCEVDRRLFTRFWAILALTVGPGRYHNCPGPDPGPYAPGPLIILKNILSQICSRRTIFKQHTAPGVYGKHGPEAVCTDFKYVLGENLA